MQAVQRSILIGLFSVSCSALGVTTVAAAVPTDLPASIEVFTTLDQQPTGLKALSADARWEMRVFVLDGIHRLEAKLSQDLPADGRLAEREVLRRLQALDKDWQLRIKASAEALMRAMELGVERYPAIVFDEALVAYGVTDLPAAIAQYRQWRDRHWP